MYFISLSVDHYLEKTYAYLKIILITPRSFSDNIKDHHQQPYHSITVSDLIGESCYSSFDLSSIYEVISDLSRRVRWCNAHLPYLCKPGLRSRVPQLTVI